MNVFSIVMPVHNKENYIEKSIRSILNQSYTHFELILINDGSSDTSGEICEKFAERDARIKVFHQVNCGVSNARNKGIGKASNELIAFIDADDWWAMDFLSQMNCLIDFYPNNDFYAAKHAIFQDGKNIVREEFFSSRNIYVVFDLFERCAAKARFPIHTSSVIIRKHAIQRAGYFDERISVFEDFDLFVRVALNSKITYLNSRPLSFYNLDVPPESKARGEFPELTKHWIWYFDKYKDASLKNEKLKLLIDRAILSQLINYRRSNKYRNEVKMILATVNKKNFGLKYSLIYSLPPLFSPVLFKLYSITMRLKFLILKY